MQSHTSFDIQKLPNIPQKCSEAYRTQKELLLYQLNSGLSKDESIIEMTRDVPHTLIYDLHRYHVALLSSVLELRSYELLLQSLPWEYRAYHNQGLPYEYFLHTYRFWKLSVEQVFDKECTESFCAIYDWLIAQHSYVIDLSQKAYEEESASTYDEQQSALLKNLLEGNQIEVMDLCRDTLADNNSLSKLFDTIVQPALVRIGLLWERGEITSAKEHLATAMITKTLAYLYAGQPFVTPSRGTAIVTAAPNEYHELGAWVVATALEKDGWTVHYLGANTPAHDLLSLIKETKADLLAISAVVPFHLDEIRELIKRAKLEGVKVMIGGRAFDEMPEVAMNMGADAHLRDADDAVKKAREWQ
jgi:methanogenic corrinoid protein MtbC1